MNHFQIFYEAQRTAPSIIYMPSINELWAVVSDTLRSTFLSLVHNMQPSTPVLLFATSELPYSLLDEQVCCVYGSAYMCAFKYTKIVGEEGNISGFAIVSKKNLYYFLRRRKSCID